MRTACSTSPTAAPTERSRVGKRTSTSRSKTSFPLRLRPCSTSPASRRPAHAPSSRVATRRGGNLAEYSALTCDEALFDRIVAVHDHDGPVFSDDPSPRIGDPAYRAKLFKTVPSSSIFGLMLESRRDYRIVQSDARVFLSHSPFTWLVEGPTSSTMRSSPRGSYAFDRSLDEWMRSVDPVNASCSSTPCTSCSRARRRRRGRSFRITWRETSRRCFSGVARSTPRRVRSF